jgi:hypothetical protein
MQQSFAGHPDLEASATDTRFKVLGAISLSHFLNDMIQSSIIAFVYQVCAFSRSRA